MIYSDFDRPKLSVILPCRNEAEAIEACLLKIKAVFVRENINGEIIVSDSSTDQSPIIAQKYNVVLIKHGQPGYGVACQEGFQAAQGRFIFLADADGTYDFNEIPRFLKCLDEGYDFVIGNRFAGKMEKGAMPWLNRYLGNPILSFIFRLFFQTKIVDIHCGLRAIGREALDRLNLKTTGMEFASEMVIQGVKKNLKIKELPINYYKRVGQSKLKPFVDGWRHLRFMLLYSPLFLFFIPGFLFFLLGAVSLFLLYFNTVTILGLKLQFHPMFLASLLAIVGYQLIIFAFFAKTYAMTHLGEENKIIGKLHRYITIEKASFVGLLVSFLGLIIYSVIFFKWFKSGFGQLQEIKNSILALTLIVVGIQTISSSFMLSILGIKEK